MNRTRAPLRLVAAGLFGLVLGIPVVAEEPSVDPASAGPSAGPTAGVEPATGMSSAASVPAAATPAVGGAGAEGSFPENTLAGIYELALENDLSLERARAELRAGQEARKIALAGLLPQVQAGAGRVESNTNASGQFAAGSELFPKFRTETDVDTDSWDVSLRQPVFDMPAWFRFQRGKDLSKQAESAFSVAQQSLMVRSVVAYVGVLRAAANLRASRAQEQAFNAQMDQVQQRFEVGMVAITDVHEARAAHDLAVAQRISDEGRLGTSREQLTLLTGRPHGDLWELDTRFPVVDPEPAIADEWVTFALQSNYDIQVALNARDAAQQNARAAASEHLPTVDLALSYLDLSSDINQKDEIYGGIAEYPSDQERGIVALNLTMPLYTGGYISANKRQAAAVYDAQRAGYEDTVRFVTQETRALHIGVVSDVATYAARAQAVTSTKSALEAAQVGYEVGTRNVVDVLNAQQQYFSAVRDYENSILDYARDLVLLKRVAGTLSPADIYELNRWLVQPGARTLSGAAPVGRS